MRTTDNLCRVCRSLLVSVVLIAGLTLPYAATGQSLLQPRPASTARDFHKFLPPVPSIPWLEARWVAPRPGIPSFSLPEAGSVSAWLLTPRPAAAWTSGYRREASAEKTTVGM